MENLNKKLKPLKELIFTLRENRQWPDLEVNAPALLYEVLSSLGMKEKHIFDLLGARGYIRATRYQMFDSEEALEHFDKAMQELFDEPEP